ncbi:putative F-box protein At1g49610 [Syzygium oleosum]|uniref:putative F-box protein At1g49610 n=1 Tax=Syzygium oleosum TaxID=219896 RepID=UPI0024B9CEDE|nr:putative F-box protein At1g49610 [Syzygium oleosum]
MAGTLKQTTGQKDDDYISPLPDCLIHHIFSFLRMRDVVKTCVLSKSWRSVWTTVSDLRFSISSYDDDWFVERVLTQYGWAKVEKFHLDIESKHFFTSTIDSSVCFAIDHQVQELRLSFNFGWACYTLSPLLYSCSSLTKLCLSRCCLSFSESISWISLKSLSIQYMDMSDDVLQKILMGSPVLEYLNLKRCWDVKGIHSTSLKELVIDDIQVGLPLHISTPQLLSLHVTDYLFEIIRIVEAPSLLEAVLDFHSQIKSDFCLLKEMLCKLQNATRILFGSWCVRVMWPLKVEDVQVLLPSCKSLTLHVPIPEFSFPAIANMLATTPNLEKLVIVFKPFDPYSYSVYSLYSNSQNISDLDSCNFDHESYWHIKKKFKRWALHLKNVEIFGFYDCLRFKYEEVLTLVKFLLGHAFVLENMVIDVMKGLQHLELQYYADSFHETLRSVKLLKMLKLFIAILVGEILLKSCVDLNSLLDLMM